MIVRYGEIGLKGDNRPYFEKRLVKNIKYALIGLDGYKVRKEHGRMYIECTNEIYDEVVERARRVFGIVGLCPADKVENDIEKIKEIAGEQVRRWIADTGMASFKVETRRSNKGFAMKSPEVSRVVGGYLNQTIDEINVDVHNPEFIVHVEIRDVTYVYSEEISCYGGMPYGTAGKGMLLLSGGIDSPVAGWMIAKRGVELEAVHYHSYPFTSDRAKEKVMDLAKILAKYTNKIKIHSVNILEIQKAINENCPSEEITILSRRFMMGIAERIALETGCQALITGESIGQVASQTMEGLNVTNSRVNMPVFRPLIAMDKVDIIKIAEEIGTFETSIQPFEDCCTVFLPKRVVTRPKLEKIEHSESKLDVEGLIQKVMDEREIIEIRAEH